MDLGKWKGDYISILLDEHAKFVQGLARETLRKVEEGGILMDFSGSTRYATLTNSLARAFWDFNMSGMIEGTLIKRTAPEQEQDFRRCARIMAARLELEQKTTDSFANVLQPVLWNMTRSKAHILPNDLETYRRWLYSKPGN